MKSTVLTDWHKHAGARMTEFAGYSMPVEYTGVVKEHLAVRNDAGIFDVSHMGEFWIKGDGALRLLQHTTTNDVSRLAVGKAHYSCMPNGKGGIVDDLIIYRYEPEKYMVVVNASNIKKDWEWLQQQNTYGAGMENASDQMALIALQGPKAKAILENLTDYDLDSLGSFSFVTIPVGKAEEVIVSATGYTGAGGFELYCHKQYAPGLWEDLLKVGGSYGLSPAGLAARDTLRIEMGYCLYGNDIDDLTSPVEAGLTWIVKLKKDDEFIDKQLYLEQLEKGTERKLTGFVLTDKGIPRKDYRIFNRGSDPVGRVTSGTMSPVLQQGIGMGYVRPDYAVPGTELFIEVRNKMLKARVTKLPFIKK
ncbi:MAG: glycine cleavage system aminomethyltransferase GcvT [Bacteroidales bacterium]|jgi:aminomethyltransferase